MEKILITGAAGFVGSHLVDYLLAKKIPLSHLRLLIPKDESLQNLPNRDFDIVRGDIRDKSVVKKAMEGIQVVFHLAAKIDFDGKTYHEYEEVNVDGTRNLVEACRGKKIKKFINYSSIGVHGLPAGIGDMLGWDENHAATYTNFYGQSKWAAEEVVRQAHRDFNLPYITIRPASVYGPREKGPTLALFKAIKRGQFMMIGSGQNLMHYVYVKDLVAATYLAYKSKLTQGEFIIGGDKPVKFAELIKQIYVNLGKQPKYMTISKLVALVIAHILQAVKVVTGLEMPLFPSRVRTMTSSYYFDLSKAKRELGYKPMVGIKEGLKNTAKWYMENGYL